MSGASGTAAAGGVLSEVDLAVTPDRVFDVLLDPVTYPDWLRGAKRIRAVDDSWPLPGAAFHHVVGAGPLTLADKTAVVSTERPHHLELRAGARPLGVAAVVFTLTPVGTGTHLTITEQPHAGPMRFLWDHGGRPLLVPALRARNDDSLRLLKELVEQG